MQISNNSTIDKGIGTGSGFGCFQVDFDSTLIFSAGAHSYSGYVFASGNFAFNGGITEFSGSSVRVNSIVVAAAGQVDFSGSSMFIAANNSREIDVIRRLTSAPYIIGQQWNGDLRHRHRSDGQRRHRELK